MNNVREARGGLLEILLNQKIKTYVKFSSVDMIVTNNNDLSKKKNR